MTGLTIRVGGYTKEQLLAQLQEADVHLNTHATAFINDDRFQVGASTHPVEIKVLSLSELKLPEGGTYAQVLDAARSAGLHACPPEVGPYLRLHLLDQAEDNRVDVRAERGAPYGSITVASNPLSADEEFPKGLYLRRLDGQLWLRGYRSWDGHVWSPEDVFAFCVAGETD